MHYDSFIGTYSDHGSEGIYGAEVTVEDEVSVRQQSVTEHLENPSFLTLHPDEPFLYAVHETENGQVSSYRIGDDGVLVQCNKQRCGAAGPCYCSVHPSGKYLFVAQYSGGAVSMLPIRADGTLGTPADVVEHDGSGPNPDRQKKPHPHATVCGPNGTYLYIPDLGTDKIVMYEIDLDAGALVHAGATQVAPGAGPRHLDFHPSKPTAYLITELDSTVIAYEWDAANGTLSELGTASTIPGDFEGENLPSEIAVHPSGEWIYAANRGHDSVSILLIRSDGDIELAGNVPTGGAWPRYLTVVPSGEVLLVQNQASDNVVPFRIKPVDGTVSQVAGQLAVPAPANMVVRPV